VLTRPALPGPGVRVMDTDALCEPMSSASSGLMVNCTVVPPADSAPLAGNTVSHGASMVMLNVSPLLAVAPNPGTR